MEAHFVELHSAVYSEWEYLEYARFPMEKVSIRDSRSDAAVEVVTRDVV